MDEAHRPSEAWIRTLERTVAVLETQVNQLVGEGFVSRLTIVEQKIHVLEVTLAGMKRFVLQICAGVLITMLVGFVTSYLALQTRSEHAQQQLDRIERQLTPRDH